MKRLTEEEKHQIINLTNQKLSTKEIAKRLHRGTATIERFWRKNNLHSKYLEVSLIGENNKDKILELVKQDKSDYYISKLFNCSVTTIFKLRKKYNIERKSLAQAPFIELTQRQKEILIGSLLGDSSLIKGKNYKNPYFQTQHSDLQKEYVYSIMKEFSSLSPKLLIYSRKYKRKDSTHSLVYSCFTGCNQAFVPFYNEFYINGVKQIPFNLLQDFTALSLAYLIMDDGYYAVNSIGLCLCSFSEDQLDKFIAFLYDKFNLTFKKNYHYNKHYSKYYISLRLINSDFQKLKNLIKPHIQDWALYKLGGSKLG